MAALTAILLLAAAPSGQAPAPFANWQARTGAEVSARATVRIVGGARVRLGKSVEAEGAYTIGKGMVRLDDGTRRPATFVEFQ